MSRRDCPLIFGEVLFDVYNETVEKLGGAPFNVARHLQGFALDPVFISKIGADKRGKTILSRMQKWQMSTEGVASDPHYPTGMVSITLKNDNPFFSIMDQQAYDYIEYPKTLNRLKLKDFPLLYHGTLAIRNRTSAKTLKQIKKDFHGITFIDINLRDPWWNKNTIIKSIHQSTWLKCNRHEFSIIKSNLNITANDENQAALQLLSQFNLHSMIITRGEKGAVIYTRDNQKLAAQPKSKISVLDSVGAGDALSAVMIIGILKKWDLLLTLQRAVEFAAHICRIQGAVPEQSDFYSPYLKVWNLKN
jgi:fructokinase